MNYPHAWKKKSKRLGSYFGAKATTGRGARENTGKKRGSREWHVCLYQSGNTAYYGDCKMVEEKGNRWNRSEKMRGIHLPPGVNSKKDEKAILKKRREEKGFKGVEFST